MENTVIKMQRILRTIREYLIFDVFDWHHYFDI